MIKVIKGDTSVFLDFFRGISAQLVLLGHLLSFFEYQEKYNIPIIQNFGVIVFFVLSGFLIVQTSFLKTREYGLGLFLVDRFTRIYYSFVPALIFVVCVDYLIFSLGESSSFKFNNTVINFLGNLFMLQAYPIVKTIGIESFGSGRPFWTVSVEWWLYIFWGVVYYCFPKSLINIKWGYWLLFLLSLPIFFYNVNNGDGLSIVWFFGFLLAVIYNHFNLMFSSFNYLMILLLAVIGLFLRTYLSPGMYDLGIAVFFSLIVFLTFYIPQNLFKDGINKFFIKFSKFIASFSYSLYLIHYTIIECYLSFVTDKSLLSLIAVFVVSNILAYFFYLAFEKNSQIFKKNVKRLVFNLR